MICLKDIYNTFKLLKRPVKVLETGAGPGAMTWKMIAAQADVLALTKNRDLADLVSSSARTHAIPFIELNALPLKTATIDLQKISERFDNSFDIAWSSNLNHYSPTEVKKYVQKLYKVLKPGGRAYLVSLTPSHSQMELDAYKRSLDRKHDFPGYLCNNHLTFMRKLPDSSMAYDPWIVETLVLDPKDVAIPKYKFMDLMGSPKLSWALHKRTLPNSGESFVAYHRAIHRFDATTLFNLFSKMNFDIKDLFYFSLDGKCPKVAPEHFTDELRKKTRWGIAIMVKKPAEAERKFPAPTESAVD